MLAVLGGSPGDGGQMTEDRSQETEVKMMLDTRCKAMGIVDSKNLSAGFFLL
jgi:hypothetical protein